MGGKAMTSPTAGKHPAAAGGDTATQLRHLRAHRAFQRQENFEKARIDWKTVIDQDESRRHVARHLHAKINQKAGGLQPAGRMNTGDGQESMVRLARRVRNRERISPGDGLGLSWNLRRRMVRAGYPRHSEEAFEEIMRLDHPGTLPAKDEGFPPEVKEQRAERERLKQLLAMQGASPKRHREAVAAEAYACRGCRNLFHPEAVEKGQCPVCIHNLEERDLVKIAVKIGPERTPMGCVEPRRGQEYGKNRKRERQEE